MAVAAVGALALAACSSTRVSGPTEIGDGIAQPVAPLRHEVIQVAASQVGIPYRYGGNSRRGFDCSGLVQYAHRQAGIEIPRTTESQWASARTPDRRQLLPGDLLFFDVDDKKSRHVAIYEGDGLFIHAPSSGKRVSRASLDNPYWQSRLIGTKTFL
ncbi:MAG: C40 family peptidase [Chromatiaceae bacterium]|jgi:cell wall-associated NlpC family hydrolase|nr:C40 family peptidase [Chromatiaceae bacterium]